MSSHALAQAVISALGGMSAAVHDTEAASLEEVPWVVVACGLPSVRHRSLAGRAVARDGYVRVTCVAGTGEGARLLGDEADAALEGARLVVPGWVLGPVRQLNVREPEADFQVELTNGRHPVTQIIEYRFTANRK